MTWILNQKATFQDSNLKIEYIIHQLKGYF